MGRLILRRRGPQVRFEEVGTFTDSMRIPSEFGESGTFSDGINVIVASGQVLTLTEVGIFTEQLSVTTETPPEFPFVGQIDALAVLLAAPGSTGLPSVATVQSAWSAADTWVRAKSYGNASLSTTVNNWVFDSRVATATSLNDLKVIVNEMTGLPAREITGIFAIGEDIDANGLGWDRWFLAPQATFSSLFCHEFMHSFSLGHANSISPQSSIQTIPDAPWTTVIEYGDSFVPLGAGDKTFPAAAHLSYLGWLPDSRIHIDPVTPVTIREIELDLAFSGERAIKLTNFAHAAAENGAFDVWIEMRTGRPGYQVRLAWHTGAYGTKSTILLDGVWGSGGPEFPVGSHLVLSDGRDIFFQSGGVVSVS